MPAIREPGDYPGKADFEQIAQHHDRRHASWRCCPALVLLSNTMSTLIGEQTGEIAAMKAIGGSRRQIAGSTAAPR